MAGEWTTFRLGDVCTKIGSGATPHGGSNVYLDHGDVALIRSQNVHNDGFHNDGLVYLTDMHAAQLANVEVEQQDVLLNITGDSVARVCQVEPDILPARVNQHVAIIRTDPKVLWPRYLRFYLVSPTMQAYMLQLASAGATRNALTKGMIESLIISAPYDIKEQQAIACILGMLEDKIELNRRMSNTLAEIAGAIFKSWFIDFEPVHAKAAGQQPLSLNPEISALFPDSFVDSMFGEIPKGWTVGRLSDFIEFHDSKRIPLSSRERQKRQGSYRYFGAAGIIDYVDDFLFDGIFVLVGEDGSVVTTSGNPVVQYVWGKFWVNNHAHVLKAINGITNEHLLLLIQQINITPFITGAAQPKLSQTNLKDIPVIHCSPELNKIFGQIIQPLFAKQRLLHDEINLLANLRDALLPRLVSGKLAIADAERIARRCD